jgi:hypothetical protein
MTTTPNQIQVVSQTTPLTAEQRFILLQKKIGEYRSMLNTAVNGDGVKSLTDLFLVNILKDLIEIQTEINKSNQLKAPSQTTFYPTPPGTWNPGILYGGGGIVKGDGVCGPLEMQKTTVCAGQTCGEYVPTFLTNNNEENS